VLTASYRYHRYHRPNTEGKLEARLHAAEPDTTSCELELHAAEPDTTSCELEKMHTNVEDFLSNMELAIEGMCDIVVELNEQDAARGVLVQVESRGGSNIAELDATATLTLAPNLKTRQGACACAIFGFTIENPWLLKLCSPA
jgi:hypothetical protein